MTYDFDYGFDVDTLEDITHPQEEQVQTNDYEEDVPRNNEYYEGEKEAIEQWLKEHKKSS